MTLTCHEYHLSVGYGTMEHKSEPAALCIPHLTLNDTFVSLKASAPPSPGLLGLTSLEAICSVLDETVLLGPHDGCCHD